MHKANRIIPAVFFLAASFCCLPAPAQVADVQVDTEVVRITSYFDTVSAGTAGHVLGRPLPDSVLDHLRKEDAYWYANLAPVKKKKPKEDERSRLMNQQWFQSLMWIIITVGFVAVLLWYLASSDIRLFRKRSAAISGEEEEPLTENIFDLDFDREIEKSMMMENFRLTTRLLYLRTLKELSDEGLIHYQHEKTNRDYLDELAGTRFYQDFFRITREFEYIWYGKMELSRNAFSLVEKDFVNFKQQRQP